MAVIKSLILILALAAPLSAIKCIQCAEYDDSKTDAIQKQKIDSWSGELMDYQDLCNATPVAEDCEEDDDDSCSNMIIKSKVGGNSSMTIKLKGCGRLGGGKVTDTAKACEDYRGQWDATDKDIVIDECEYLMCAEDGCNSTPEDTADDTPKGTSNDTAKDSGTTLTASVLMITAFLAWLAL